MSGSDGHFRHSGGFGGSMQKETLHGSSNRSLHSKSSTTEGERWIDAGVHPVNLEAAMMDTGGHSFPSARKPIGDDDLDPNINAAVGWMGGSRPNLVETRTTFRDIKPPEPPSPPSARGESGRRGGTSGGGGAPSPPERKVRQYVEVEAESGPTGLHVTSSALAVGSKQRRNWRKTRRKTADDDDESSSGSEDDFPAVGARAGAAGARGAPMAQQGGRSGGGGAAAAVHQSLTPVQQQYQQQQQGIVRPPPRRNV